METEYNRRISEKEAQFLNDNELAGKKYEKDLAALEEKFEGDLQDLRDQHAEERAQWAFEKEELVQESVELQEELENIENEKQGSYSEISQQKDLLETSYKERVKNLQSEKARLQSELEELKIAAEQVKVALNGKIRQLENDLREELMERDEEIVQAETNMKHLQDILEDLEKKHKLETEELGSKLSKSKALYEELSHSNEKKRHEMLEEITRLKAIIDELKDELGSLSKVQAEYKLVVKENLDLKNVASRLQKNVALLEEERSQNESLQAAHDQIVNEKVGLLSEISRLQEKLNLVEKEMDHAWGEEKKQYASALEEKLKNQGHQLYEAEKSIQVLQETLQKIENQHVAERGVLNGKLLESEALYKEICDRTDTKRQEMLVEITRLQSTINELQNEVTSVSDIRMEYTTMKKENEDLKKLVSDLRNSPVILEEERSILKNLQKVHEQTVKENVQLLSEIAQLQEKMRATEEVVEKFTGADKPNTEELDHGDAQHLKETIEKLVRAHKSEKEELNSKLMQSKKLNREMCVRSEKEGKEMASLQGTIKELKKEMATLWKTQGDFKVVERENEELKGLVAQLKNRMVVPEDDMDVYKSLQAVHEQTVKENVRLLSEISRLQKQLLHGGNLQNQPAETDADSFIEFKGPDDPKFLDPLSFSQYKETLDQVNVKLQNKTKELKDVTKMLSRLEQSYDDVKTENGHLKAQTILLQDRLSGLTLEYDQVKKAINLEVIPLPELKDAPITVPGLKLLLAVARKENLQLKESLTVLELKNIDAIENNKVLSSEVSWLQKEIQNMEEMAEASLKLEQFYNKAKKENLDLKSLVQVMQEKVNCLEKTHLAIPGKQAVDLKTEVSSEPSLNPGGITFSNPHRQSQVENVHVSVHQENHICPEEPPRSQKLQRNGDQPGISSTERCHDASLDHGPLAEGLQETSPRAKNLIVGNERKTTKSDLPSKEHEIQKSLEHLR